MKTIILIQHTESEHHVNHHIGAQYEWKLTARGREQAFRIGKWLKREGYIVLYKKRGSFALA